MDDRAHAMQARLDAAMPWVGLYITAASAVCTLAMAADVFHGLQRKMLWFPCKYFSLNAASLTVLAVAMKLPMDIDTQLYYSADWAAKMIGIIFMITTMSNFMPSLGSKSSHVILTNVVAQGILAITILVNFWIATIQLKEFTLRQNINAIITTTVLMLVLLATMISSAITIPISRRIMESRYQEMHEVASREREAKTWQAGYRIDKQTLDEMKRHWIAVETGNLQFVAARSIFCVTSGLICLLSAITLVIIYIKWFQQEHGVSLGETETVYGKYTKRILVVQSVGVAVGMIAPLFRWFFAVRLKFSEICHEISSEKEFKVEPHWIQTLVDWRDNFDILQNWNLKFTKYLYDVKWLVLTFCIGFQVSIVLLSKMLLLCSAFLVWLFFMFFDGEGKFRSEPSFTNSSLNEHIGSESGELNPMDHVLLLEGEAKLPKRIVSNICHKADKLIQQGKTQQPQNLIRLLSKIRNFDGVREFDSRQVPSLHSQEPPNCWTLPLVTLTSIAVALPNVSNRKITQLVSCLNEGISLTKLIDKTFDANARLMNIRRAADMGWGDVALYRKWQAIDLRKASSKYKKSKEVLQELARIAEKTVVEFNKGARDSPTENPLNWPVNVVASNSMYRISQTILLSHQQEDEQTDEEVFEQLSATIAGIFAACLTNLVSVIVTLCHCNALGKREKSARKAFLLLGKTEQVLELLQQYEWPSMNRQKQTCIEEWCASVQPDNLC